MTVLWSFRLSCKLKDVLWNTDSLLKNFQLYQTSAKNMLYTISWESGGMRTFLRLSGAGDLTWWSRLPQALSDPPSTIWGTFAGSQAPSCRISTSEPFVPQPFLSGIWLSVSKPVVSRLFIWNESEARIGCCSDNGSVLLNVSLLWRAFGYCRLLWNLCCLFQLWSFFKSNYNISPYFPHHQHQNGKKSFTDGLQRSVLGMVPPPHLHSSRRSRKVEVEKKCTRYGCRLPAPL